MTPGWWFPSLVTRLCLFPLVPLLRPHWSHACEGAVGPPPLTKEVAS
jgi:hypothetical protein